MKPNSHHSKTAMFIRLFFLAIISITLQLQSAAQNDSLSQRYLEKSRNKKAGGFVLLGVGLVVSTISISTNGAKMMASSMDGGNGGSGAGGLVVGIVCIAASIPLFISSGVNKRKAAISLSSSSMQRLNTNGIARVTQPCLKLSIPL